MALTKIQGKGIDDIDLSVSGELELSSATSDTTDKRAFVTTGHYTNSEENAAGVIIQSVDGDNLVDIGGGTAAYNAATKIRFYTASNNTTTTGTEAARIVGNKLLVGTTAAFGGANVGHAEFFESGNAALGVGRGDSVSYTHLRAHET